MGTKTLVVLFVISTGLGFLGAYSILQCPPVPTHATPVVPEVPENKFKPGDLVQHKLTKLKGIVIEPKTKSGQVKYKYYYPTSYDFMICIETEGFEIELDHYPMQKDPPVNPHRLEF